MFLYASLWYYLRSPKRDKMFSIWAEITEVKLLTKQVLEKSLKGSVCTANTAYN